jgi:protein-S-isoprenylcysteine O-methyltransferase Ste14
MAKGGRDLALFDPARWPAREILAKIGGCLFVLVIIVRRTLQLPSWPGYISEVRWAQAWFAKLSSLPSVLLSPDFDLEARYRWFGYSRNQILALWGLELAIWIIETGLLLGYALIWLTRSRAQSLAKGFWETFYPLILVLLPFGIVSMPYTYNRLMPEQAHAHIAGLYAINGALLAAGLLNIVGLIFMRRSFAIMAEARVLVRNGPYRLVRHPMYLAHFVIFFCCTLLRLQALTAALYVVFVVGQIVRARIEERKLAASFPEYEDYRRTTGMFFPKLF